MLITWIILTLSFGAGIGTVNCPNNGVFYSTLQTCYWKLTEKCSANQCNENCKQDGGLLATIGDADTATFLKQTYGSVLEQGTDAYYGIWIGLTDSETEGQYKTYNGNVQTWASWRSGDPNDDGSPVQDCVAMYPKELYTWQDRNCDEEKQPLCFKEIVSEVTTANILVNTDTQVHGTTMIYATDIDSTTLNNQTSSVPASEMSTLLENNITSNKSIYSTNLTTDLNNVTTTDSELKLSTSMEYNITPTSQGIHETDAIINTHRPNEPIKVMSTLETMQNDSIFSADATQDDFSLSSMDSATYIIQSSFTTHATIPNNDQKETISLHFTSTNTKTSEPHSTSNIVSTDIDSSTTKVANVAHISTSNEDATTLDVGITNSSIFNGITSNKSHVGVDHSVNSTTEYITMMGHFDPTQNNISTEDITTELSALCSCICRSKETISPDEFKTIVQELTISKKNTSANRRKLISASDDRPSARNLGYFGATVLGIVFGSIILLDITSFFAPPEYV